MRTKLENCLNIFLPRSIDLHHIDLDRKNNQIKNLILIRKSIHKKIHLAIKQGLYLQNRIELQRYLREIKEPRKLWLILKKY